MCIFKLGSIILLQNLADLLNVIISYLLSMTYLICNLDCINLSISGLVCLHISTFNVSAFQIFFVKRSGVFDCWLLFNYYLKLVAFLFWNCFNCLKVLSFTDLFHIFCAVFLILITLFKYLSVIDAFFFFYFWFGCCTNCSICMLKFLDIVRWFWFDFTLLYI